MSVFDRALWDQDIWGGRLDRPGAGWGSAWRVWYQVGPTVIRDLTAMTVEMRWTTDSRTTGDGAYRGDLQPGKASIRFWDPTHRLETLDKRGAVWATYTPTGATWCWFLDSIERGLVAPNDPQGADVVFTGDTWPMRLTAPNSYLTFPVQTVTARLAGIVAAMQTRTELALPQISLTAEPGSQLVPAPEPDNSWWVSNFPVVYPSYLDQLRAAAVNGCLWLAYGRDATGAGTITVRYTGWGSVLNRGMLDLAQVVAGPPTTQAIDWVINQGRFTATKGDTGAQTVCVYADVTNQQWGLQRVDLRMLGDVSGTGPENPYANNALAGLTTSRRDPSTPYISTINAQSGDRKTSKGLPSTAVWDPTAHVFAPNEWFTWPPGGHTYDRYRVAKSDHTLNAFSWQTTHTLDMYIVTTSVP